MKEGFWKWWFSKHKDEIKVLTITIILLLLISYFLTYLIKHLSPKIFITTFIIVMGSLLSIGYFLNEYNKYKREVDDNE